MTTRTNLLHGLTSKRFLTTLLINALIAAALYRFVWDGKFGSALVSTQVVGLSILLSWTMASNWKQSRVPPLFVQLLSVVVGSNAGGVLVLIVKGYELDQVIKNPEGLINLITLGVVCGAFIILIVVAREREARAQAAMHQAEAERHLHGKQLLEARLQLMQAQIEPHFLFNTLASVQHLVDSDPAAASRMLGDLIKYLRAAMPQMREQGTTIGREAELVRAYLAIQRVRIGNRFDFSVDIPEFLGERRFPPMMLLTLAENAVKHGFETKSCCGEIRVTAHEAGNELVIEVRDNGAGFAADCTAGVGLANLRERLQTLYGDAARLTLEENVPSGVRARITVPNQDPAAALPAPTADVGCAT
jgi:LytS/YehU family sensor histidine kinase